MEPWTWWKRNKQCVYSKYHIHKHVMDLFVHKFDPNVIQLDRVLVFIGRRDTGKSTLLTDILYTVKRKINDGIVVSGTESANHFWEQYVPKSYIYEEFEDKILWAVIERQKARTDRTPDGRPMHTFVILDDVLHDEAAMRRSKAMKYLMFNGRHLNIFLCIVLQYPLGLSPAMRSNVDYAFILRAPGFEDRKKLFTSYAGIVSNPQLFNRLMDDFTEDRHCLVVNNTVQSNDLSQCVFWYKAKLRRPFLMGGRLYRQYHEQYRSDRSRKHRTVDEKKRRSRKRKGLESDSRAIMQNLKPNASTNKVNIRKMGTQG